MKKAKYLNIISYSLMFLFIYASTAKLIEYDLFVAQIGKSPLITDHATTLAWLVPAVEIIITILLFLPATRLLGLYASFFIMAAFTVYIVFILTFSPYVPCSCGGILNRMGWTEHLIFNIVFTILPVVGVWLHVSKKNTETHLIPSLN